MSEALHEIVRYQVPGYIAMCYFALFLFPSVRIEFIQSISLSTALLSLLSTLFLGIPLGFILFQIYDYGLVDKVLIFLHLKKKEVNPYFPLINKIKEDVRREFLEESDDFSTELKDRFNNQIREDEAMNPNVIYDAIHRFYGSPIEQVVAYVRRHKTFFDARGVSSTYSLLFAIYLVVPSFLYLKFYEPSILIDIDILEIEPVQTVAKFAFCYASIIFLFYFLWKPRKRILRAWNIFIVYAMRKYEPDIRKLLLNILARLGLDMAYERAFPKELIKEARAFYYNGKFEECIMLLLKHSSALR